MIREEFKITLRAFFPDIQFFESEDDGWSITKSEVMFMPLQTGLDYNERFVYGVGPDGECEVVFGPLILRTSSSLAELLKSIRKIGTVTCSHFMDSHFMDSKKRPSNEQVS